MNKKYQDIIEVIKKESRRGYGDTTVFGGFSRFVEERLSGDEDPRARASMTLAVHYNSANLEARREILKRIFVLLQVGEEGDPSSPVLPLKQSPMEQKKVAPKIGRSNTKQTEAPKKKASPTNKQSKASSNSLQYLKNVGPKRMGLLKKLGISTVDDLVEYFPKRHEDRREITPIGSLTAEGKTSCVICGMVQKTELLRLKKNLQLFKAYVTDDSGGIVALWFNQAWLKDQIQEGDEVLLYGRADFRYGKRQFTVSEFSPAEHKDGFGILPIYGLTEGISQKLLRTIVKSALAEKQGTIEEFLPEDVRQRFDFVGREWAIQHYHFPDTLDELQDARRRLVFDEFFLLRMAQGTEERHLEVPGASQTKGNLEEFSSFLPFTLTNAQHRAIEDIFQDMASPLQMMRLVEGDVGSGKTAVAAAAVYRAVRSGHQCAFM
ncbi:MAG: hypothetical protein U0M15_02565, partial [Bacillota bacterium]|nr:hypothetical protein [Bacillota bacterium]